MNRTRNAVVAVLAALVVILGGAVAIQASAQAAPATQAAQAAPKIPVNTGIPRLPVPAGQDPLTRAYENMYLCMNWAHVHPDITSGLEFDWMSMCIRAARDEINAYLFGH